LIGERKYSSEPLGESNLPSMGGRRIAFLEARRATELAQLIGNYGGAPLPAPALREEPVDDPAAVGAFLDRVAERGLDLMLFQPGVGARALFRSVAALGREAEWRAALAGAVVAVRGPKPVSALRELDVRVDLRAAEPFTTPDLLAALADQELAGRAVGVQHYGEPNEELVAALRARGAEVLEVEVYRWALPDDLGPIRHLLAELLTARVDALIVTSQVQVRHLWQVAASLGLAAALPEMLLGRVVVAAVGPLAARALRDHGIRVDLEPEHPKMGPLIRELAMHFQRSIARLPRCPD
jgi:uroporphyrinogen-III synthase